jgi:hypothetical protein
MILEEDEILDQQRSLIRLELTDDNSGSESTSGLQSSRDAFSKLPLSIGVRHVSGFGD